MLGFLRLIILAIIGWIGAGSAVDSSSPQAFAATQELVVDAVVASVNGKPVTLQDVCSRLNPRRKLTLQEASFDPEARAALDGIIMELLIEAEAESKRIGVSDSEIDEYMAEVAARNNLSPEGFKKALEQEHKSLAEYKKLLRVDILRSKLSANFVRGSVSVSDEEIDSYLKEHSELSKSGSKIKLRQILIRNSADSDATAAEQTMKEIVAKLARGDDFAELAREFSQAPEASEGGLLGMIAEEDLSSELFDAIYPLKSGEVSAITKTPAGYHLFKLEERLIDKDADSEKQIRAEARRVLEQSKMQDRVEHYLSIDLFSAHTVDKKI